MVSCTHHLLSGVAWLRDPCNLNLIVHGIVHILFISRKFIAYVFDMLHGDYTCVVNYFPAKIDTINQASLAVSHDVIMDRLALAHLE